MGQIKVGKKSPRVFASDGLSDVVIDADVAEVAVAADAPQVVDVEKDDVVAADAPVDDVPVADVAVQDVPAPVSDGDQAVDAPVPVVEKVKKPKTVRSPRSKGSKK